MKNYIKKKNCPIIIHIDIEWNKFFNNINAGADLTIYILLTSRSRFLINIVNGWNFGLPHDFRDSYLKHSYLNQALFYTISTNFSFQMSRTENENPTYNDFYTCDTPEKIFKKTI